MNFKDIYSDANNELHGNHDILEKLLSQERKKRRWSMPVFIPVAVATAVAAVVMIITPYTVGLNKSYKPDKIRIASVDSGDDDGQLSTDESVEPYQKNADQTAVNTETSVGIARYAMQENTPTAADEPLYENEQIPVLVTENLPSVSYEERELSINLVEQLAGAEAVVMTAREIVPQKEMTADEYAEYIGVDIPKNAAVPEGFEFLEPELVIAEIKPEDGSVIKEKGSYIAHSEDYERFFEINVSKTQDILISDEGFEKSEVCGNQIIVLSDGVDFNSSFTKDEVQYLIRTCKVTQDELENLLISLNGGI